MFDLYLESPNTGDFSSEINVDLEVAPLFPRQNYSSFFQPRSQPRERVSFLFELRHFLSDRTLNGKMSSVAGASRFSFSLHEPKKKNTGASVFPVFEQLMQRCRLSPGLFVFLAFRRQNMISRS